MSQLYFLKSTKNAIKHWYIPLLVGIFFIAISIFVLISPISSLLTFSILFAISFLIGGISEIIFSITNRSRMYNWGWTLTFGIITLLLGLLLISQPLLSLTALIFYVGFTILFRSISSISFAIDLKRYGNGNWISLIILGVLGAGFSFILLWNPALGGLSLIWLVALSFFFSGLFHFLFSFQLKKLHSKSKKISPELQDRYKLLEEEFKKEWGQH